MKRLGILSLLSLILLVSACTNRPNVTTDYDTGYSFAALKTFVVVEATQDSTENLLISPFTFSHTQRVVEEELSQRYRLTDEGEPDFKVHYHIVFEEKLDPGTYDSLYGFSYYGRGYRYFPPPSIHRTYGGPRVYQQGNLIIDIVDGKTQKPIWRGVSEKRLRHHLTPQQQRDVLTNAVHEVLMSFPPIQ